MAAFEAEQLAAEQRLAQEEAARIAEAEARSIAEEEKAEEEAARIAAE